MPSPALTLLLFIPDPLDPLVLPFLSGSPPPPLSYFHPIENRGGKLSFAGGAEGPPGWPQRNERTGDSSEDTEEGLCAEGGGPRSLKPSLLTNNLMEDPKDWE